MRTEVAKAEAWTHSLPKDDRERRVNEKRERLVTEQCHEIGPFQGE